MLNIIRDQRLSILWTVLRVWIGWQWLEAGLKKIGDPKWMDSGIALKGYWAKSLGLVPNSPATIKYGWYQSFIAGLHDGGHHVWFAKMVVYGEILAGIALILGAATVFSLSVGAFMNLNYMLAGSTSSNPVMYSIAILLLIAGSAAYVYSVDRVVIHYFKKYRNRGIPGRPVFNSK